MVNIILELLAKGFIQFILWYVVVMCGITLFQMALALFITPAQIARARTHEYKLISSSKNIIPISLLIPAFNKEESIIDSIKSMLNLNYLNFEIVVINDGSNDNTLKTIINTFSLHKITYPIREQLATKKIRGVYYNPDIPRLKLIDKENGGKADALNAGINLSLYPYFVSLNADSILDPDALLHIAMAFMKNKYTISVGGVIRVSNGCTIHDGKILEMDIPKKTWSLFQTLEYFRSFLVGRVGMNGFYSLLVISGAFEAYQKSAALAVGGYTSGAIGEEMDLVVKLHQYMRSRKYKYHVSYLSNPVCWTQAPETLDLLYKKRRRWQIGLIDALGRHKRMFLNPRYGVLGILAMPYYFLFEMVSPIVEIMAYILIPLAWFLGLLSLDGLLLFYMASVGFGIITSIGSLVVEELTNSKYIKLKDLPVLILISIVENLFYRQMTVLFRMLGIFGYRKYKHAWYLSKRKKQAEPGE